MSEYYKTPIADLPRGALEHLVKYFGFRQEMLEYASSKDLIEYIARSLTPKS